MKEKVRETTIHQFHELKRRHHYRCVPMRSVVLTLCDSLDCSLPGSSVHGISQARVLEWVAISSPRDWTCFSCFAGQFFTTEPPEKPGFKNRPWMIYTLKMTHWSYYSQSKWKNVFGHTVPPHPHIFSLKMDVVSLNACSCVRFFTSSVVKLGPESYFKASSL